MTETWLHLLFEDAKPGEVLKSSLHRVSLGIKRSKDLLILWAVSVSNIHVVSLIRVVIYIVTLCFVSIEPKSPISVSL